MGDDTVKASTLYPRRSPNIVEHVNEMESKRLLNDQFQQRIAVIILFHALNHEAP